MIQHHSKLVKKGDTFICIPNPKERDYIEEALKNGAKTIVGTCAIKSTIPKGIKFIETDHPRLYLANALTKQRNFQQPEVCIAVTGTNGKTSVVHFIHQIWEALDIPHASFGTLGLYSSLNLGHLSNLTTPDPVVFHSILKQLFSNNIQHFAFEASSHGLAQFRTDGCQLKAVGFTNLSHEHLDYHHNTEEYFNAKKRLFTELATKSTPKVICQDSSYGKRLISEVDTVIPYGQGTEFNISDEKLHLRDYIVWKKDLNLFGDIQYLNLLCAAALVESTGISLDRIVKVLPDIQPIPGRLEYIKSTRKGAKVFVDFAHTPDALRNVLSVLRPLTTGQLFLVFGCGGERDEKKRPIMGKIAYEYADIVIITDDNPRHEHPDRIRFDILKACDHALDIPGRDKAIAHAMYAARHGDIILVAGRGHEMYQEFQGVRYKFNDRECIESLAL